MEIPPDAVRRTANGRGTDYTFLMVVSIEAWRQGLICWVGGVRGAQ